MTYQDTIRIQTSGHRDIHDITGEVNRIVSQAGIQTGIVHIFNVGSTGVIGMMEFEPGLKQDLPELLDRLIPPGAEYEHEKTWHDGNGHSHLQATLAGASMTMPVSGGELKRGTWQQVFHLECDVKPRRREIMVTLFGA